MHHASQGRGGGTKPQRARRRRGRVFRSPDQGTASPVDNTDIVIVHDVAVFQGLAPRRDKEKIFSSHAGPLPEQLAEAVWCV